MFLLYWHFVDIRVCVQRNWRAVLSRRRVLLWRHCVSLIQDVIKERMARLKEERLRRAALMGCVKIQVKRGLYKGCFLAAEKAPVLTPS